MISAAYKAFRLHAVLPGTVCHICGQPCASACVREQVDQAIDLKSLERFCWQQMRGQPKKNYYIREKKERILICGGGPRELTAAVKLARRGYPVDMAVKGEQLGGALWEMGEERLPAEVLEEDLRDIYEEKLIHVTSHVKAVPRERWNEYAAVLLSEEYEEDDELLWEEKCFRPGSFGSPLEEIRHERARDCKEAVCAGNPDTFYTPLSAGIPEKHLAGKGPCMAAGFRDKGSGKSGLHGNHGV